MRVLQCVAVRCSAVQCVAVRCSAVQRGAMRCSAVHCVAVRCLVYRVPCWRHSGANQNSPKSVSQLGHIVDLVKPIADRLALNLETISKTFSTNQNSAYGVYD